MTSPRQPNKAHHRGKPLRLLPAATRPETPAQMGVSPEAMSAARDAALRERDTVAMLYSEASEHALLSAEEEAALARAAQGGDTGARDALLRANVRLVMKIATYYHRQLAREGEGDVIGAELDDLISDGLLGATRAIETFNPARGRFTTYATHWIRQRILRGIGQRLRAIRIPEYLQRQMCAADEELPAHLRQPYSLDALLGHDNSAGMEDDDATLADFLPSAAAEDAYEWAERGLDAQLAPDSVTNIIRGLAARRPRRGEANLPRMMAVLVRLYVHGQTQTAIAADLGVSYQAIQQIVKEGQRRVIAERTRVRREMARQQAQASGQPLPLRQQERQDDTTEREQRAKGA